MGIKMEACCREQWVRTVGYAGDLNRMEAQVSCLTQEIDHNQNGGMLCVENSGSCLTQEIITRMEACWCREQWVMSDTGDRITRMEAWRHVAVENCGSCLTQKIVNRMEAFCCRELWVMSDTGDRKQNGGMLL